MSDVQTGWMLSIVGIGTVFAVLAVIALFIDQLRRFDDRAAAKADARAKDPDVQPPTPNKPTIDDTTLVLITAAAATLIQGRFRVRRIRRLGGPDKSVWSQQGRATLMGSHVISPQPKER